MDIEAVAPLEPAGRSRPAQSEPRSPGPDGPPKDATSGRSKAADTRAAPTPAGNAYARFVLDRDNRLLAVQVISAESGQVLREIPPDGLKRSARGQRGLLVNMER